MTEQNLRAKCKRHGIMMKKSRRRVSADNYGGFQLVEANHNLILAGEKFDLSLDDVEDFLTGYLKE